jgi:hypothetical protein
MDALLQRRIGFRAKWMGGCDFDEALIELPGRLDIH